MLFYNIYLCILLHVVVLSKSEKVNISLSTHLDRQNKLFSILYHVHQTKYPKDVTEIASRWSLEEHKADFTKADIVSKFLTHYNEGLLPKDQVFTPFYESHLEEAIALFRLFFYAKDWDTFYKTLAWARKNVNSQMLIYALFLAVDHRKDCKNLVVPPIYEVYPHLFVDGLTVREVGRKKINYDQSFIDTRSKHDLELLEHDPDRHKYHKGKVPNNVTITNLDNLSKTTSVFEYPWGGTRLMHLYKDIGVNAMYYYFNIRYPMWMSSREFRLPPRRGEAFLNFYQQLSARCHLERTSEQSPELTEFHFDGKVENEFKPGMLYPNGQRLPNRWYRGPINLDAYYPTYAELASEQVHIFTSTLLVDSERRIRDAIDMGYVLARNGSKLPLYQNITEGLNLIGNIIEGNADSPNQPFYGSMMFHARHLLAYPIRGYGDAPFPPCGIEQLEVSLRDPLFWRLIKKVVNLYQRYLYHLPPYTLEDLVVPGVQIKSVDVELFVKNTEFSEIDMINTFNHTESEKFGDFQVRLRLMRPKPDNFSYTIHVESETATKLCFKVFLGPAVNYHMLPVTLSKHRMNMFNLDKFSYNLKKGQNTIERNITDSPYFSSDERPFSEMYREILSALAGNTSYKVETFDPTNTYAWPLRFVLPIGKTGGMQFRFFVAAFQENDTDEGPLAMLYPFDRPIKNEKMFQKVPNFYSHTVLVEPHPCSGFMDRPSDCNKQ